MKNFTQHLKNQVNAWFYTLLIVLLTGLTGLTQNVGINATGAAPNDAAGLEVDFPDKGVLIPRVALESTSSFAPLGAVHVAGMLIYNTATVGNVTPGFYYNNGTEWINGLPTGTSAGNMLYWNGTNWLLIPVGLPGQYLQLDGSGLPAWIGGTFATVITNEASNLTGISATSGGNILSDGGSAILSRGVCYRTSTNPTIANSFVTAVPPTGTGTFSVNLTNLIPLTTYYTRAYATNSSLTTYGNEVTFTTLAVLPTLAATTAATNITGTSATSGGNVTSDGGAAIIERGICYGTTANPTIANSKVIDPNPGTGLFTCTMEGLTGYTTYYVRAYATNSIGTAYGTQISFITLRIPPTLATDPATNILHTSATSGGNVTWISTNGYTNTQDYGVAYSTIPNSPTPTYVATNTTNHPISYIINPWVTNLTGLASNTTYYIRSYLKIYGGAWITVFGNELSFTTNSIGTTQISTVTQTTAVSGGTIATNVVSVIARGVCWSTNTSPTIADNITSDGTGTGMYVSSVSGLTDNTTYYLRAYYTDGSSTTFYGNQLSFTTGTPKAIGDNLAGGKVVWVDITGQHGLIAALVDQAANVAWGCYGTLVGTTTATGGHLMYAGLNNTNLIIAAGCGGTPAQVCASYTAGGTGLPGITNWYMPSKDEFNEMYNQRALIGLSTGCGTYGCYYWTSTEYSSSIAYCIPSNFYSPNYNLYKSNTTGYVRAVRAF